VPNPIPLLDLKAQHASIREEVVEQVLRVIDSQAFILGPDVTQLEEVARGYCSTRHAIGCASGSDALYLALLALGIGHGDEVLTSPYTFFATAGAVVRAGARPVFADIEPGTFNLDPAAAAAVLDTHPAVKAIIPVHLYGAPAEMNPLLHLARNRGIAIIEDAAQAIGAEYLSQRCGSIGEIGCFSFFPSKNLGGYGDAGLLTTNDDALAAKLRSLRVHGSTTKYYYDLVGINSRIDALQAAVLTVKFRHLDGWTAARQSNAALYREILGSWSLPVILPQPAPSTTRHVYNQFVVRAPRRDELRAALAAAGIGSEIYYPLPLHLQACFSGLGYREGDFPVSEAAARDSIALPIYPELGGENIARVCEAIRAFCESH
jgi:dTDP-4-amino-4,6-dideoxygalactose transaminase